MRILRTERGQATVDYVALIGLLALLLAAAATVTAVAAPGIANAVVGQLRRALCIVSGGDCPPSPRRPCTLASTRDARHAGAVIGVVRLDDDTAVLRERLSDGTIRLTVSSRDGGGVEGGVGAKAKVEVHGHEIGFAREARAGVEGVLGHGSVYYARSDREADALLQALAWGGRPRASEVFYEGGVRGLVRVEVGGAHVLDGQLDGMATAIVGARHDRRSGQTTVSLSAGSSGSGLVSLTVGGGAGVLDGQAVLGLTLDRQRHPIELSVTAAGRVAAGATMPAGIADALKSAADPRTSTGTGGRRWELGARADLRDPAVAGAWRTFRGAPASPAAIRALGEQLRRHATVDVRSYELDGSTVGAGGSLGLGIKLGGEFEHAVDHARLLAAATRPPWGLWEPRLDCGV